MSEIDQLSLDLLEEAKGFYQKAAVTTGGVAEAYMHAGLVLAFSSLEAHVNAIQEEMCLRTTNVLELSILSERDVKLKEGRFTLSSQKFYRIEDRIDFLLATFGKGRRPLDDEIRSRLNNALSLRNGLVHPKSAVVISLKQVEGAIRAVLDTLEALYRELYSTKHPKHGYGLDSLLDL